MKIPFIKKLGAPLLAGSLTLSFSAIAAQGLYSADELMDADVYDSTGEEIGEVEDILLGDDMSIQALVIETGEILGLGGREVVAKRGTFTVRTESDDDEFDDIEYEVHMEATQEALKSFPQYDEDWWTETRQELKQAWKKTKRNTKSAWESTKEASASAWDKTKRGAEKMGDKMERATDDL
ncbi:PRC-barrel domain-containing protein [Kineobactrum salinum]|uniref:PRC-barrel domain containing protein n=1 Tax=Kineobactrum salinum TaxID=2708301 RepID=A0A6C0U5C6_9GAMM|nr:PRC-barrel domain-containing protein [Kineobactrum salinum]QIB66187.1 PRC-barrel domain containing protein [Kineobactrum salinum]